MNFGGIMIQTQHRNGQSRGLEGFDPFGYNRVKGPALVFGVSGESILREAQRLLDGFNEGPAQGLYLAVTYPFNVFEI